MIFTKATREAFRKALKTKEATALAFVDTSRGFLDKQFINEDLTGDCFGAMCLLTLAEEYSAENLLARYEQEVETALPKANLTHALWAQIGAMIYDCLEDTISSEQKMRIQTQQVRLANALLTVGKGNPHTVTNNWWGITHSGLILACLCLPENKERNQVLSFAIQRLRAFLHHFGPACLYHEGLGYQDYTLSHILPALVTLENHQLFSFENDFPQVEKLAHSLFLASAAIPALQNRPGKPETQGGYLCWNDAGHDWPKSSVAGLSIRLSNHAPALWTWFHKLADLESPLKNLPSSRSGLYYNALCYPHGLPLSPLQNLPNFTLDTRQGQLLFRTQWKDADDLILGVLARSTHVGGHSHDDAGSLRVIGMGYDWILGGGQNRPQAEWQSIAIPMGENEKKKTECGAIFYEKIEPKGFTLGLDLRKARGAYYERYLSFTSHPSPKMEGALCILDQIDEHRALPWAFHLTLSPQHQIHEHANGITLIAPDKSCMNLHFFTPPDEIILDELPKTSRTFSNGNQEFYSSFPVLKAAFAHRKHLSIYTLITFSKSGHIPKITIKEGLAFQLDDLHIPHPFESAISQNFRFNQNKGLCQDPLYKLSLLKT